MEQLAQAAIQREVSGEAFNLLKAGGGHSPRGF